jgi:hypothetical protein
MVPTMSPTRAEESRQLVARTRVASLGTRDLETGAPYVSLVAVADDGHGRPLLLLSGLAEHTKNLVADGRASLLLAEASPGDSMDRPRVTLTGALRWLEGEAGVEAKTRFLAAHPEAERYASLPDFRPAQLEVASVRFVGGFGRASHLSAEAYLAVTG